MSKENLKFDVSDEDITKALETLDNISAIEEDESDDFNKGEEDDVNKAASEADEDEMADDGAEKKTDNDADEDDDDIKKSKKKIKKGFDGDENDIVKAIEDSPMLNEFQKSLEASAKMVEEQVKQSSLLFKGMNERMISLQEEVTELQNTPIKKSLTHAKAVDRFEKGGDAAEEVLVAKNMNDKEAILKGLDELTFPEGARMNEDIAKAMATYEASNELDTRYVAQLSRHLGKKVVA